MQNIASSLRKLFSTLVLLIMLPSAQAQEIKLEPKQYSFGKVSVPQAWFVRFEEKGLTAALFASAESIEKEGQFKTGLTINAIKSVQTRTALLPTIYARALIDQISLSRQRGELDSFTDGKVRGNYAMFKSQSPEGETVVQVTLVGGNNETGTVFIVTFESPEPKWQEAWKVGDQIIKSLKFNDAY